MSNEFLDRKIVKNSELSLVYFLLLTDNIFCISLLKIKSAHHKL